MRQKKLLIVAYFSVLLVAILGTVQISQVNAAPAAPTISLQSPKPGAHFPSYVPLIIVAESSSANEEIVFLKDVIYYVDSVKEFEQNISIPILSGRPNYTAQLTLSEGIHTIRVVASAQAYSFSTTTGVLSLSPITYFDSGKIQITIDPPNVQEKQTSGTFESDSGTFKVTIEYNNSTVYLGQPLNFTARVTGGNSPYFYQWTTERILGWNPLRSVSTKWQLNSPNFSFIPDTEGTYHVSVFINDSIGNYINISPVLALFFDVVSATPSPSIEPQPTVTPSPSPTSSTIATIIEPTLQPTFTPKSQTGFLGTNLPFEYGYALVAVLVTVIVAGLSLVYLKKLRK
jgi:hypothetical protein